MTPDELTSVTTSETCPYALVADLSETHIVVQLIADAQAEADVDYRLAEGSRRNPRGLRPHC